MIPFNKPYTTGKEIIYINDAINRGKLSGNGFYTGICQQFFENKFGFNKTLLTTSCTDALEMCALLLDIKQGDEVIMPSYTFVSTANAFALRGANIVFADVCSNVPNLDVANLTSLITEKTKAIVVTHYGGIATDMDALLAIAIEHGIFIVEDAAQCIGGTYKNLPLGSIGHLAAFSFHETKNIHAGEGGMLVINDKRFESRAEVIWEKGTNRSAFFKGEVDSYNWIDIGSSFLPSEITAAFLYAQIEAYDDIMRLRKACWDYYFKQLESLSLQYGVKLMPSPELGMHNNHVFALICHNKAERDALIGKLGENGYLAVSHYKCLHESPYFFKRHDGRKLLNSKVFEECLVRLPLFPELSIQVIDEICGVIRSFYKE